MARQKITQEEEVRIKSNVLAKLREGKSFIDACEMSGVSETTIRNWGKGDARFKAQLNKAREEGKPFRRKKGWRNYKRLV